MAKYQQYAEYKDSGVEWLGEIPRDWMATELKRNCKVTDGSHHSPAIEVEGLPFISVTDVGVNKINFIDSKKISDQSFERLVKEGCKPSVGDVLLTKDGTIGRACIVTEQMPDFVILSSLGLLTPSRKLVNKYLYYYLISGINIDQMNSVIHGSALRRMTISKINDLVIAFPQKEEDQTQIASFLDHETAQIDTLIEKQQTLIQLLKEKRQAVISHAVTKGLNFDAPMKDSGVEWLGEIPEHWETWKLSHAFDSIGSGTTPSTSDDNSFNGTVPWVTTGELRENVITDTLKKVSKLTMKKYSALKMHPSGSVVIAMYGATIGRVAILGVDATTNQACCVLSDSKVIFNKFLFYWLFAYRDEIVQLSSGGGQPNINQEKVASLKVSAPEINEQIKIVNHLDDLTIKIDTLTKRANKQIQLMQERRTALISAAVTGKIDVRGWQAPDVL